MEQKYIFMGKFETWEELIWNYFCERKILLSKITFLPLNF